MTKPEAKERLWKLYWTAALEKNGDATEAQIAERDQVLLELSCLDARSMALLFLRYRQHLTFKRIAEQMHYSVKQVLRIHDKALEKYIEQLKGDDENV